MSLLLDLLPLFQQPAPAPTGGDSGRKQSHNLPPYRPPMVKPGVVKRKTTKVLDLTFAQSYRVLPGPAVVSDEESLLVLIDHLMAHPLI